MEPLIGSVVSLRLFRLTDLDAVREYTSNALVTRYTAWSPQSREEAEANLKEVLRRPPDDLDHISLVITESGHDKFVGVIDLHTQDQGHARAEVGFGLLPAWWGRGLMTDALRCLTTFAFARTGLHRIEGTCHPENEPSASVLTRSGFRYEGRLRDYLYVRGEWRDSLMFSRLRTDT